MSGGFFDYNQFHIQDIREDIQQELDKQGKEVPERECFYSDKDYYVKYPEERFYTTYPAEIQEKFVEAIEVLKKAEIYTRAIDYYLSGDTEDKSFLSNLQEKLNKIDE